MDKNDNKKNPKSSDSITSVQQHVNHDIGSACLTRERSFVRTSTNQQNLNKRRSLAFNNQINHQQQYQQQQQQQQHNQNQIRGGKPAMEIYRPPKLNYNIQHSTSSSIIFPTPANLLQHSKSNANIQQMHHQLAAATAANRFAGNQHLHHHHHPIGFANNNSNAANHHRALLVSHPLHQVQLPLLNPATVAPGSGKINHSSGQNRVKFAVEPQITKIPVSNIENYNQTNGFQVIGPNLLQRSKSLSSADTLTRGMSNLGLGSGNEGTSIGQFSTELQNLIDKAVNDPNQLNARNLMELATHVMQRAVEGRRYALPIARLCIVIIAKEDKETFLEALLNTCRQWYQEREKILYSIQGMKSPSRTRFTAFMAFLTEMFCQLKRRQLQLRTQCDGVPPPLVLLTLLAKCCEDCVKPPVRSLSEIECLFFVLTCIGRDLEIQLPDQLEKLLSAVRDAFLNSTAYGPAIRKTLLQLIELQASRWQLPGNTVLYYYPSTK